MGRVQRCAYVLAGLLAGSAGWSVELAVARVGDHLLELDLGAPASSTFLVDYPRAELWRGPAETAPSTLTAGALRLEVRPAPLAIVVRRADGTLVQDLRFADDLGFTFGTDQPVYGLGENGSRFDRRGGVFPMIPRWGGKTEGSVLPSPLVIGADGWALFVPQPHGGFDLRGARGQFRPTQPAPALRCFVLAWRRPAEVLAEYVRLTGRPVMPPKWALGYMQSHRTLAGPREVLSEARTFRAKQLPCDALIYLGTGYCPAGWNQGHGSLEFNPGTFDQPAELIQQLHADNFKVVLHVNHAPKTLHGASLSEAGAAPNHLRDYWQRHRAAFALGVDGFWPDDGDELPEAARLARHRVYYQGPLSDRPNERPWSLHRTGTPGIARYGGWIWSGDIDSTWATLAAQVRVGLAASLSVSPFWGTDIGGFVPRREYTGELFVRWFQFAAFTPLFRSHGRTWHLHLPWGWNTGEPGPLEEKEVCDAAEWHNASVEPACREALDLRYQLLPYNYTLAREACDTGVPPMRALWLHYPADPEAARHTDEYLWGRDLLVAPVVTQGATTRGVYLPAGTWYDWWTGERLTGGATLRRAVTLNTIPLFARAGAIVPLDPVRQFTSQAVTAPTELRVFPGADGDYTLYDDDGHSLDYLESDGSRVRCRWEDAARTFTVEPAGGAVRAAGRFSVRLGTGGAARPLDYTGQRTSLRLVAPQTER